MDLIIGAGITGLSYAAFTNNEYLIVEKSSEYGGYCKTIKKDGFTWDYSGHFFHFKDEDIKHFVFDRMKQQKIYEVEKITTIYHKGNYIDFPFQKNIHQLPKEDFIDCLYDLSQASNAESKTFKEMLVNTYGNGISERFLIPYNEKLYACDLNDLDVNAMGRFFPHADIKSIISNFKQADTISYNNTFVYPEGGAIEYVHAIASEVELSRIKYNTSVNRIDVERKLAYLSDGSVVEYNNLITTIPFPNLLDLVDKTSYKEKFKCNKVAVFNLGFNKISKNKEHWVYYPDKEYSFYRIGFYNNIYGSDRLSMYVEIGYDEDAVIGNEENLLSTVMNDLRKVGVIDDQELISYEFIVMNPAYVHINNVSMEAFSQINSFLKSKNIYTAGRYGAWRYCSIEDNIIEAKELVERVVQ